MVAGVRRHQRWSEERPCPICGGWERLARGKGTRCTGFVGSDGAYAHCSREELAGGLNTEELGTYAHRLEGPCNCGETHGDAPIVSVAGHRERTMHDDGFREIAHWDYEGGLRVVRREHPDGRKAYSQQHRNGKGFVPGRGAAPITLYRAPELAAADPSQFLWLGEGEKVVEVLRAAGLLATTTPGGAGQWGRCAEVAGRLLAGRHVVILPDNDDAGRKYAADAVATLRTVCASLRVLELPGLGEAEDVADWLARGGDPEDLVRMAEARPDLAVRPPPASVIEREWRALDPTYLTMMPPARRWLLRHPTRDGEPAPPNGGDGLLPLGKVGILASEGGAGKTNVVLALAVAIATRNRWLGHFVVDWEVRGRILLGLAEEDAEEVHRRLYSAAEAYGLTAEERAAVAERVVILPLAGMPVALVGVGGDGRTVTTTAEFAGLHRMLEREGGPDGWSLVVLDPLARWAGADVEGDTPTATRFVQALEMLSNVPGHPCVLIPHHSSKISRRENRVDARGVTAITDGSRWMATLRAEGASVMFLQVKSNYSRPMFEELRLLRSGHGLLSIATEDDLARLDGAKQEKADEKGRAKEERREKSIAAMEARMLAALAGAKAPITSQAQLRAIVPGDNNIKAIAAARLLSSERIIQRRKGGPLEIA